MTKISWVVELEGAEDVQEVDKLEAETQNSLNNLLKKMVANKERHDEDELCWKLTLDRCEQELGYALVRFNQETDHVFLSNATSHVEDESCWYLDTWCSNHMKGKREWLINLDTSIKSNVRFADNSVIMAEGAGKVLITRKDGRSAYMINVLYVPTMKSNLLSLGQLLEKGYTMSK
ncbi:uncharacterized protein LOC124843797 [Vigna umbellata]|uniref:uncharacterized protein LOC124843797 n=1 Tax=Vigna umbellata TaxID=87088 RepID=UPI001F5F4AF1|nr:uncharacterized protein LOC124843797 [Vigna umbellata]